MESFTMTIAPSSMRTRLLLTHGPDELLRAILPPPSRQLGYSRAVPTLLEGLAQWVEEKLHVVLPADAEEAAFSLGLVDALGVGTRSLFYDVALVDRRQRRRGARIRGVGDFADLRQLRLEVRDGGPL